MNIKNTKWKHTGERNYWFAEALTKVMMKFPNILQSYIILQKYIITIKTVLFYNFNNLITESFNVIVFYLVGNVFDKYELFKCNEHVYTHFCTSAYYNHYFYSFKELKAQTATLKDSMHPFSKTGKKNLNNSNFLG